MGSLSQLDALEAGSIHIAAEAGAARERETRAIEHDQEGSMEIDEREGYF